MRIGQSGRPETAGKGEGKMRAVSGLIEYNGKEYDYTAQIGVRGKDACPDKVTEIDCADGTPVPDGVNFDALEELAMDNALLLDWCEQEGWQIDRSVEGCSSLIRAPEGLIQRVANLAGVAEPQTMREPIVFGVYNWKDRLIGKTKIFNGGFDEWIESGDYVARKPYEEPEPILKEGVIYSSDNGMLICKKCAGQSALYTGRDTSGQEVLLIPRSENKRWKMFFGEDMACERGCTSYAP